MENKFVQMVLKKDITVHGETLVQGTVVLKGIVIDGCNLADIDKMIVRGDTVLYTCAGPEEEAAAAKAAEEAEGEEPGEEAEEAPAPAEEPADVPPPPVEKKGAKKGARGGK